ncbi:MAG: cyclase family protein [Gammaproteobacteria bacterium]|nr:cyclase family protein [Gammaproteobacteria bacterium]
MDTAPAQLLTQLVAGIAAGSVRVVDLTVPLEPGTPIINLPAPLANSQPFALEVISRYDDQGPAWYWNNITCGEHTGTHFDAPIHWLSGRDHPGNATHDIPVQRFIGPACVLDVTAAVQANPDFLLTRAMVEEWEAHHGRIPAGAWVLVRTDWSKRQGAADYLNVQADGPHTPGFDPQCVRFLAHDRDILGVGVETVGTDAGQAGTFEPMFPCHTFMHGANRFGLAQLTNLDRLPPTGAVVIAPPLKIVNGSGSPLRVLALVPA